MVDELTEHLKDRGYQAEGLHGDLTQGQRDTVMNLFRGGRTAILIATDVAARGIDVDDVEAVFNYDVPEDIEYYVHRIGRTGRAGKTGRSFTLVVGKEIYKLHDIERVCHTKIKERNIPSAADITSVKAEKVLGEALETLQTKNLEKTMEFLEGKLADGEYTALELAAAFMKIKMGDDLKEIKVEKFKIKDFGLRKGGGSDGKRGEGRRRGDSGRSRRREKDAASGGRREKDAAPIGRKSKEESRRGGSRKKDFELGIRRKEGKSSKLSGKKQKSKA